MALVQEKSGDNYTINILSRPSYIILIAVQIQCIIYGKPPPKLEKNLSPTCKYILSMETENRNVRGNWPLMRYQVNPIILSNNLFSHNAKARTLEGIYTQDHRVNFPAVIRKVISPDKEGKYIHLHTLLFMTTVIPRRTRDPEEEDVGIPHYTSRACHMY